jgi:uncharacterized protein
VNIAVYVLIILAVALFIAGWRQGDGRHVKGIVISGKLLYSYIPLLLLAFLIAGLLQVVLPPEIVQSWLGAEAGWRGIIIGTIAGMMVPAGPYVAYPIFASIMQSGAGIGTVVALVTGWSLLSVNKLPFELALLGPRFTLARLSIVFLMPVLAGFLAQAFFAGVL